MRILVFTALYLVVTLISFAQSTQNMNLWASTQVKLKLTDRVELSQEVSIRNRNLIYNQNYLSESQLKYDLNDNFQISTSYRWGIQENFLHTLKKTNRYSIDARYSEKVIKGLEFKTRSKWQYEINNRTKDKQYNLKAFAWRNRFTIEKKVKKGVKSEFGVELFFFERNRTFNEFRLINNLKIKVSDRAKVSMGYFFTKQYRDMLNRTGHTLSASLEIKLKKEN